MKIIVLDASTLGNVNWNNLKKFGELFIYDTSTMDESFERIKNAHIVITNKSVINKKIIDNAKNLKFIQVAATGTDNIDITYATEKGIIVKNVSGYSTESVVQLTFAIVLAIACKLKYFDNYTREKYYKSPIFTHIQKWNEIKGKTWGIIGLGNIGKKVATIAECFGANIVYYSTSGLNNNKKFRRVELNELLKFSDIITIHAPLNDKTRGLLDYKKLSLLKQGSIIVNVGRGGIVKEEDISKILKEKDIFAGFDVFEKEPVTFDNPLLEFKEKTILTPHIAWTSLEARERLMETIFKNISDFIKNL